MMVDSGPIHEIDVKALAGRERNARFSVRPEKAEYAGRFAVDVESSGGGSQSGAGIWRGSSPRYRQKGDRAGYGYAGRNKLPAGQERRLFIISHCSLSISTPFWN
jgi:hypothetical protein